jgi:hypothetical protein
MIRTFHLLISCISVQVLLLRLSSNIEIMTEFALVPLVAMSSLEVYAKDGLWIYTSMISIQSMGTRRIYVPTPNGTFCV